MNKIVKYTLITLAVLLVIGLSLDIKNLEKYKSTLKPISFDAATYAENFWNDSLPVAVANALQINELIQLLNENPEQAFEQYGHKLGISKTWYFMVKGSGTIEKVEDEFLVVGADSPAEVKIKTDFIYGNAVREGSGKVNINHFVNMTDFNNVSVAINKWVKEKVTARLKKSAKVGQQLEYTGAMEIKEENSNLSDFSIIPVSVKLTNGE